jgi:flagellar protein FliL
MSAAATAAPVAAEAVPAKSSKKKLIVIAAVLAVLLAGGGGGAWFMMKKRAAAAAEAAEAAEAEDGEQGQAKPQAGKAARAEIKGAPTFVPLDPFTVNLADRDAERYAQIGLTLELADPKAGDLLKAYMPAIRNNVLLVLAGKTAAQLIDHDGKLLLAAQVRAAALKPLGYSVDATGEAAPAPKKKKAVEGDDAPPIRAVHFSNFIIQ